MKQIDDYIKGLLNEQQYQAAKHYSTSSLILAGAGSGKTRTLTYKIAYLIYCLGVHPSNILAVTFTNKAANEMKERLSSISDEITEQEFKISGGIDEQELDFDDLIEGIKEEQTIKLPKLKSSSFRRVGTFHGIFLKILKEDIDKLGLSYNKNFGVYDEAESQSVVKNIINSNDKYQKLEFKEVKRKISFLKNAGKTYKRYQQHLEKEEEIPVSEIYEKYQKELEKANSLDFDDLLLLPSILFEKIPEVLTKWQEKFKYILVDEAQDTNGIQFQIIRQLSGEDGNVTFIGDDFQSIYGWRGAVMDNFLNISNYWDDVKTFKLETNYRSKPHIVKAGTAIIENNSKQYKKQIVSHRQGEDKIRIFNYSDEIDESMNTVKLIRKMKDEKNFSRGDFAILYRTNAQSQPFEQILVTEGIPYKIWGGFKFFDRKEIKDLLSYIKYMVNPKDSVCLKRIINTPNRKIGATTINKLDEYAAINGMPLNDLIEKIDNHEFGLGSGPKNNIKQFFTIMKFLRTNLENQKTSEFIQSLISTIKYKEYLITQEGKDKTEERMGNIGQLINMAMKYDNKGIESLTEFLEEVSLMTDLETDDAGNTDNVKLMSVHSSKGLEFPVVFIVGLEDNIFPLPKAKFDHRELEEERRLMYVAITRAKDLLFISYANSRQQWGQIKYNPPSQFIGELPEELIKKYDLSGDGTSEMKSYGNINEGDIVDHKLFGKGKVFEIWGDIAVVKFDNPKYGLRKMDCRFISKIK